MKKITFDTIYNKLSRLNKHNAVNLKQEKLLDEMLHKDEDYLNFHNDIKLNNDIKVEEKVYGNNTYGIYMYKICSQMNDYYVASMIITKIDDDCEFTLDNILSIRSKDEEKVKNRYEYLQSILNNYSEEKLLEIVDSEVNNLKKQK